MRHKDNSWDLPALAGTWEVVQAAILMDIRDELKLMNQVLQCHNTKDIPSILRKISINTNKPKKSLRKTAA